MSTVGQIANSLWAAIIGAAGLVAGWVIGIAKLAQRVKHNEAAIERAHQKATDAKESINHVHRKIERVDTNVQWIIQALKEERNNK